MDFVNRSAQPARTNNSGVTPGGSVNPNGSPANHTPKHKDHEAPFLNKWFRAGTLVLLFSVTVIIVAIVAFFAFWNNNPEAKLVNKSDYQAVFVNVNGTNGGQVYFGHVQALTDKYIQLTNVFYIQNQSSTGTASSTNSNSYTLVKLGCELHGPEDQMVINRDQVYFWENLKGNGQVSQKIAQYYKSNPNGQNCSQSSASSSANQSSASTQNSTNTSTPSTTSTPTGDTSKQ
jgi:hypothetical protein